MLEKIKLLLNISDTSKDFILETLIEIAISEVKQYCNLNDVTHLEAVIIQMVIYKFNVCDNLGINSENYGGASFSYNTTYPDYILNVLNKNRKCKLL